MVRLAGQPCPFVSLDRIARNKDAQPVTSGDIELGPSESTIRCLQKIGEGELGVLLHSHPVKVIDPEICLGNQVSLQGRSFEPGRRQDSIGLNANTFLITFSCLPLPKRIATRCPAQVPEKSPRSIPRLAQ